MNSLTGEKEDFVPIDGNKVAWYTCGPTVYDSAHMGHARANLTFDILRRIMMNYFNYDVKFHMNITDIDDKIILRSRQNKLFSDYCGKFDLDSSINEDALIFVNASVAAAEEKLIAKEPKQPPSYTSEKERLDFAKLAQEHEHKLNQHLELKKRVSGANNTGELLTVAADCVKAQLDRELGHTIVDHSIFEAHARKFEKEHTEDMDALGIMRPDVSTRISEYMDGPVQNFIKKLQNVGVAYESKGSVYFDIDAFKEMGYEYRKIVPATVTTQAEMEEGEGALAADGDEKRNANDFALWKASRPGEPSWQSEWGPGRPGWHVECSVMATSIHGDFLDIHGGGEDLKFPHHDNEIAQSEAYLGRPQWANYFFHAGHLKIEGLKMSKSLKNFITIRQALEKYTARQIRMMFLIQNWDRSMNFSDQSVEMAKAEERKAKHVVGRLYFHLRHKHSEGELGELESSLLATVASAEDAVGKALRDNFDMSQTVEILSKLLSECYPILNALPAAHLAPVQKAVEFVLHTYDILGVTGFVKEFGENEAGLTKALDAFAALRGRVRSLAIKKAPAVDILTAVSEAEPAAEEARKAGLAECADKFEACLKDLKDVAEKSMGEILKRCDQVRDVDFVDLGVRLEDLGPTEFAWMHDDREVLLGEQQEAAEKAAEVARNKLKNKLQQKQQDLRKFERNAVRPDDFFKDGTYAEYDHETGIPTKLASGEELSGKKRNNLTKELAKHVKEHEKLVAQAGHGGIEAFLSRHRDEVEALEKEVNPH